MQKYNPYTGEYQCKCGRWLDHSGLCEDCERDIEKAVDENLLERGAKE